MTLPLKNRDRHTQKGDSVKTRSEGESHVKRQHWSDASTSQRPEGSQGTDSSLTSSERAQPC